MGDRQLDQAWGFVTRARLFGRPEALDDAFGEVLGYFGFDRFDCVRADHRPGGRRGSILGGHGMSEWNRHYYEQGFARIDPCAVVLRDYVAPFAWSDMRRAMDVSGGEPMWSDARSGGMQEGHLTTWDAGEAGILVRMTTPEKRIDPDHRAALAGIAVTYALTHHELVPLPDAATLGRPPPLSGREIECLAWVLDGKTNWEISVILTISEHTVSTHLRNAMAKLGVATRIQAAAAALRAGLLSIA